ncbi:hypothetical protein Ciccas_013107, partial [Cichlidogyrus casuarinus]
MMMRSKELFHESFGLGSETNQLTELVHTIIPRDPTAKSSISEELRNTLSEAKLVIQQVIELLERNSDLFRRPKQRRSSTSSLRLSRVNLIRSCSRILDSGIVSAVATGISRSSSSSRPTLNEDHASPRHSSLSLFQIPDNRPGKMSQDWEMAPVDYLVQSAAPYFLSSFNKTVHQAIVEGKLPFSHLLTGQLLISRLLHHFQPMLQSFLSQQSHWQSLKPATQLAQQSIPRCLFHLLALTLCDGVKVRTSSQRLHWIDSETCFDTMPPSLSDWLASGSFDVDKRRLRVAVLDEKRNIKECFFTLEQALSMNLLSNCLPEIMWHQQRISVQTAIDQNLLDPAKALFNMQPLEQAFHQGLIARPLTLFESLVAGLWVTDPADEAECIFDPRTCELLTLKQATQSGLINDNEACIIPNFGDKKYVFTVKTALQTGLIAPSGRIVVDRQISPMHLWDAINLGLLKLIQKRAFPPTFCPLHTLKQDMDLQHLDRQTRDLLLSDTGLKQYPSGASLNMLGALACGAIRLGDSSVRICDKDFASALDDGLMTKEAVLATLLLSPDMQRPQTGFICETFM